MPRRFRSTALSAATLIALTCAWAPAHADAPRIPLPPAPSEAQLYSLLPLPEPDRDAWYADPPDLARYRDGDPIRSRDVPVYALGAPVPVFARQVLYRSTDALGAPLATATTVLVPGIPWLGPGPRPLISYQEAIDSLGAQCNPSFTLRAGLNKEIALLGQFLELGAAVAVPDFDGKRNTILSPAEGHLILDGLRAVQRSGPGLEHAPIGLWGYSGGGNATVSAAEAHRRYAPELAVRAAAAGGVPGDKAAIAGYAVSGTQFQANFTGWLAVIGLSRTYPTLFDLDDYLTPEGVAVAHDMAGRCLYSIVADSLLRPVTDYLKSPDALSDPRIRRALRLASFGDPRSTPDMPLLMWHSTTDQLLPDYLAIDSVVRRYCAEHVDLRFLRVPASEHISADIVGEFATAVWLLAVTSGVDPGRSTC
jgi:hypothetical protein